MTPQNQKDMIRLLQEQKDLYLQLEQLSEQQHQLVAEQDPEQLLRLLASRQHLIAQLGELNRQMTPLRSQWSQDRNTLDAEVKQQVNQLVDDVESLLNQIIEADEVDRRKMRQARDRIGGELARFAQVGAARQAYGAAGYPTASARFTNQQG